MKGIQVTIDPAERRKIARDMAQSMERIKAQPEGSRNRDLHCGRVSGIRFAIRHTLGEFVEQDLVVLAEQMMAGVES